MGLHLAVCGYDLVAAPGGLQLTACGYDLIEAPTPAPFPTLPALPIPAVGPTGHEWEGSAPDGTPLGRSLLVISGTTLTARTSLGVSYPATTRLSATIEDQWRFLPNFPEPTPVPPFVVAVPHVEWADAATGLVLLRIAPGQSPRPRPNCGYFVVIRVVVGGIAHEVVRSSLDVLDPYVAPAETP